MGRKHTDYTGQRFGKLVAVRSTDRKSDGRRVWLFQCDCGKQHEAAFGNARSCGCDKANGGRASHKARVILVGTPLHPCYKHGKSGTPEYAAFISARLRCTNPKVWNWKDYGGRGIEFRFASVEQFIAEVGLRQSKFHSLDRYPNCDGNYEPGNVRWATWSEQMNNRQWNKNHPGHVPRPPRPNELLNR